jgi:hypothetical protein
MATEGKGPPQAASPAEWRVIFLLRRIGSALRGGVDLARLHVTGGATPTEVAPSAPAPVVLDAAAPVAGDDPVVQS